MMEQPQYDATMPRPALNDDDIEFLLRERIVREVREILDQRRFLNEMATIGKPTSDKVIMIRMNDGGNVPHFHIMDSGSLGNEFETCVRFDSNRYFHHHGKEGVLNAKERKKLVKFLKAELGNGWTNWNYMVDAWNRNNSHLKIDPNTPMPDYSVILDG